MNKLLATIPILTTVLLAGCQSTQVISNINTGDTSAEGGEALNSNNTNKIIIEENYNANINQEKEKIFNDEMTEKINNQTIPSSCFHFIINHEFVDPNPIYYIQYIEVLEPLAVEWQFGRICESADNSGYIVVVNKQYIDDDRSSLALEKTNSVYHVDEYELAPDYDTYYHIYHFSDRLMKLIHNGVTKNYEPGQLSFITELAWAGALSGCSVEPGNFLTNGLVIGCGSGDNGCATIKYANWNILTSESQYLGQCTNNCDLYPDEAFELSCQ
ncbi:MAG: hypothetical protein HYV33_00780 [Candidatus Kerfeldbacteria bacterium]|nr:hypothetical protein [Candidatus Kerfeldbacteria bacterium]